MTLCCALEYRASIRVTRIRVLLRKMELIFPSSPALLPVGEGSRPLSLRERARVRVKEKIDSSAEALRVCHHPVTLSLRT